MNLPARKKIVLLGMMSRMPVAGVVWQTVHYLIGFQRLGFDAYYVEAHGCNPRCFYDTGQEDGHLAAAEFIARIMENFGLGERWCYQPLYGDSRVFGLSKSQLDHLYASAELVINLHGGTEPTPEHTVGGPLIYLETDPVQLQIELHDGLEKTIEFLAPHHAFFTFGENLGASDCLLPASERFKFKATRQPVVLDFWEPYGHGTGDVFTTVGNWRQEHREVIFNGVTYYWSKHFEFHKFVDLPALTDQKFELALSSYAPEDETFLTNKGWRIRPGLDISLDFETYRNYIGGSRGEYTVAKDQNVRLRSGWFSDRSATYLAAGRPVITQETGFSNSLPTGRGLLSFSTLDELSRCVEKVNANYEFHRRAALEIAREHFSHEIVLGQMLDHLGVTTHLHRPSMSSFSKSMVIAPVERRPIKLREATLRSIRAKAIPSHETELTSPRTSIIVVCYNNLPFTRLCLESVLENTAEFELIVVDNGSSDATPNYLEKLAEKNPHVTLFQNKRNRGFAAANNQALAVAKGQYVVLLNNDTIVAPGWLPRLLAHLNDSTVGAVGPVTNRIGNEAQVDVEIETLDDYLEAAEKIALELACKFFEIQTLTMFCLAMRREVYHSIGPLDEGFGVGMLEDDDYSMRMHRAGLRLLCAEDVLIYHYSQASFGELVTSGRYNAILEQNKTRFKLKWGVPWQPYRRRQDDSYENLIANVRECIRAHIPAYSQLLVVSKGDEALLAIDNRRAEHFPQDTEGAFAGWYPADSEGAIRHLEHLRNRGAKFFVLPKPSLWWFDFYGGFREHLETRYTVINRDPECRIFSLHHPTK